MTNTKELDASVLLRQAPERKRRRDELFALVPQLLESGNSEVIELLTNWQEKFKHIA